MGFLSEHVAQVRRNLETNAPSVDPDQLRLLPPARDFVGAIRGGSPAVIAEVKQASPSSGRLRSVDPGEQAAAYEAAGAAAISVLTEPRHFGGSLADLRAVRSRVRVPVLRKDFLLAPSQILESRVHGADAVLLIARAVTSAELLGLCRQAEQIGLSCLVEATGEDDLASAVASGAPVIGVNARDLETLEVDEARALELLRSIPDDRIKVFESGVSSREHMERAVESGADAVLVGTALMLADDPGAKLRELRGVPG